MTSRSTAGIAACLWSLCCWTPASYWHSSLCSGPSDPLCASPWVHEELPMLSWAHRPDKCLMVPERPAAGEVLQLGDCDASVARQLFVLPPAQTLLQLRSHVGACVGATAVNTTGGPSHVLLQLDCGTGGDELTFELPKRGQGLIKWGPKPELCLTVAGGVEEGRTTPVVLAPCADAPSQRWLAPRTLGGSAFVGANLGGWLVLEEWMWPEEMNLQGIHDEWSLVAKYGGPEDPRAQEKMMNHWDTFLRPEHLDKLARFGVTHVRIPVGYWLFDSVYNASDGFVAGGEFYLARALRWLKARRMKAILDLHALPGGQAIDGFTGKRFKECGFFLHEGNFSRGKLAVEALADLTLSYEESKETSGVVVGVELLNEPRRDWLERTLSFYDEMVPRVRRKLPADRYMILLSFMDSPHSKSSEWLAARRVEDPATFAGVVYDAHLYHLFGDNKAPWSTDMDLCKTCCRDRHIMKPMSDRNLPSIVGEYGLSTGFPGWEETEGFEHQQIGNYLSLWNTTRAVVGSFTWNFRIITAASAPNKNREWSLLDMIDEGFIPPDLAFEHELGVLCPTLGDRVERECPAFQSELVRWNTSCFFVPRADADAEPDRKLLSVPVTETLETMAAEVALAAAPRSWGAGGPRSALLAAILGLVLAL